MKLIEFQRNEMFRKPTPSLPQVGIATRSPPPISSVPVGGFSDRLPLPWVWSALDRLSRRWRRARERRAAVVELSRLSPALLSDIGLECADIERVVDAMLTAREADEGVAARAREAWVAANFVCRT